MVFLLMILPFSSCNNSGNSARAARQEGNDVSKNESFSLDEAGLSLTWTAYKFTDKIAVSGAFEDYTIKSKNESGSIEKILANLEIAIPTESVDAKNAIRDFKLRSSFFEAFNTSSINGYILKVKAGEGLVKLKMNNIAQNIPFTYSLKNDTIVIFTHLDLKKWKGETAMAQIEKECVAHLKGKDGLPKLWPEVDVVIKLPVNRISQIN